jgi:OOP family OmpA-OmpF porin
MRPPRKTAWIGFALIPLLAVGCTAKTLPSQSPLAVSPLQLGRGEARITDQVIVITDASGTMYEHETFPLAKALTQTFVAAMPERDVPAVRRGGYDAGLISFGGDKRITAALAPFDRSRLASTVNSYRVLGELGGYGGRTPYHNVLTEARKSLAGKSATAALVIFSDGLPDDEAAAFRSARTLVAVYSGNVCIHTVQTGDDPKGAAFLDRLAKLTGCGSARQAASVGDPSAFMRFTHDVFATRAAAAPAPPPPAPDPCTGVIRLRGVEFEVDSDALTGVSSVVLDAAAEGLQKCPNVPVRVEGHTDAVGADAYNQSLGMRRAQSVRRYLVGAGIGAGRITARSFGESRPIAPNETEEGRALNRRVELHAEQ